MDKFRKARIKHYYGDRDGIRRKVKGSYHWYIFKDGDIVEYMQGEEILRTKVEVHEHHIESYCHNEVIGETNSKAYLKLPGKMLIRVTDVDKIRIKEETW